MERKVLAVLYVQRKGKKPRFLVVKDAEAQEWSFISGTCEPGEPYHKCLLREVGEETRGLVSLHKLPKRTKHLRITHENKRIDIMFVPMRLTEEQMSRMVAEFPEIDTDGRPELEENTSICFETMGQFLRRRHIWSFIRGLCSMEDFQQLCPA